MMKDQGQFLGRDHRHESPIGPGDRVEVGRLGQVHRRRDDLLRRDLDQVADLLGDEGEQSRRSPVGARVSSPRF